MTEQIQKLYQSSNKKEAEQNDEERGWNEQQAAATDRKNNGNETPVGDEMTNAARDLIVRNAHASKREISKVRNVCWKKMPNLNLGSPHFEVPS